MCPAKFSPQKDLSSLPHKHWETTELVLWGKSKGEGFVAETGALQQAVTATGSRGSWAGDAPTEGAFELKASQELREIPRYFLLLVLC